MITDQALKDRATRIQDIDTLMHALCEERDRLMYDGLSREDHNKLVDLVRADGKSHFA